MEVIKTPLPGVLLIEIKAASDNRGYFMETFQARRYEEAGIIRPFVQDNLSFSHRHVLRGLHLQYPQPQGKLVYVLDGEVFDVAADVRQGSPHFGRWWGANLSSTNRRQLWIPEGFAHGFCVLSQTALVAYKCTDYYRRDAELSVLWNDPEIAIDWPIGEPILSAKDAAAQTLGKIDSARLPVYPT